MSACTDSIVPGCDLRASESLARDTKPEGWAARVRHVNQVDHNTAAASVVPGQLAGCKCRGMAKGCRGT